VQVLAALLAEAYDIRYNVDDDDDKGQAFLYGAAHIRNRRSHIVARWSGAVVVLAGITILVMPEKAKKPPVEREEGEGVWQEERRAGPGDERRRGVWQESIVVGRKKPWRTRGQ